MKEKRALVWIAAGTTEGRCLAEYCKEREIAAIATVVSEYGEQLLEAGGSLRVRQGAMNAEEMETWIVKEGIALIVDATHPYAKEASENMQKAAKKTGMPYIRCLRERTKDVVESNSTQYYYEARDVHEAVAYLDKTEGAILLTTGSKELAAFASLRAFSERVFARVLPVQASLDACLQAGLSGRHIIGMQGPFSKELNVAMLHSVQARWLVTKEAGKAGGFEEKIEAAKEEGIGVVVIRRPEEEEGLSLEACKSYLHAYEKEQLSLEEKESHSCELTLVGGGMGSVESMTGEAMRALEESEIVFGAGRLVELLSKLYPQKKMERMYQAEKIFAWLQAHPDTKKAAVLLSGDSGFFSAAATLKRWAEEKNVQERKKGEKKVCYCVHIIAGISSLSYLSAKCQLPWEEVKAVSFHGREGDLEDLLRKHKKLFLLLDGEHTPDWICREVCQLGRGESQVVIGENLSYPRERIRKGRASDFVTEHFEALSVMLLLCDEKDI